METERALTAAREKSEHLDNGVHPCVHQHAVRWPPFLFLFPRNLEQTMQSKPHTVSRRSVIKGAAALGGASLAGAFPGIAMAQGTALETKAAKLGFIALTDAAPLFVADEKGFFKKHGMTEVEVLKQSSWGATRDNLVLGSRSNGIDGAHILTPMPYLISTGAVTANNVQVPINILARLNLGGQCISVANEYKDLKVGLDNREFRKALLAKRVKTGKPVNAAMTFPGGTHDMWIRYWMAAGGVDPNRDITTITVPPAQMVANMKVGSMDTFCVCEPWNRQLINQKIGYTALTTSELWMNHPEKAFAMRADYVQANPNATRALLKAVMEAQMWCEDAKNRAEVAEICSRRRWINAPVEDVIDRVKGDFDYGTGRVEANSKFQMRFWKDHASYPFQSHDLWFLTENIRWGYLPPNIDTKALIAKVNREDLWRAAAKELGVAAKDIPTSTSRGVEKFFDGKVFDPANPKKYLDSLEIKSIKAA
jgi:nitrate/nitrite transport system substrate-binding protein